MSDFSFCELELLNVNIDVWIDEEEYDEVYKRLDFGKASEMKEKINMVFKNKSEFKSIFIDKRGKIKESPEKTIQKICVSSRKKLAFNASTSKWMSLFFAKYLRAKIQEKGTEYYTEHLDDLLIYLQRKLPYQYPKTGDNDHHELILQHLYFQELSACGKPGLESLGFALRAEELIHKDLKENEKRDKFIRYKLWAKLNQGIGYYHSSQIKEAAIALNEVIRNFGKIKQSGEEKLQWQKLLYDTAILFKAEIQESMQFSYHTLLTLNNLKDRKKERRLIKEALAYRDMGRLKKAREKIEELLGLHSAANSIKNIFEAFKNWEIGKKGLISETRGLLFDYYLLVFEDQPNQSKEDIEILIDKFVYYGKTEEVIDSKSERTRHFEQIARFLKWLSEKYVETIDKETKKYYLDQITRFYRDVKDYLIPNHNKKNVILDDFDKYDYERYTDSMEKFYKNIPIKEDEERFLTQLNDYERKKFFLFKFKELERDQRKNTLNEPLKECGDPLKCFYRQNFSEAFMGILQCSKKRSTVCEKAYNAVKSKKNQNYLDLSEYIDTKVNPLVDHEYETIMTRENERFLDYLKYRSRHPIYSGSTNKSYHFMGLQRWNSQTPTLTLSQGGGYLLYEQDKRGEVTLGIAIDPGFDFVDNLFHMGFTLNDIDFILLSHAHSDHIRDFEPLVSSLLDLKKREYQSKKKIHAIMSLGVYHKLKHIITNVTLREFLSDTYIVDIEKEIYPNNYLNSFRFSRMENGKKYEFISMIPQGNDKDDKNPGSIIEIKPKKAYHDDYSERSDSYGYIINFHEDKYKFSFGYTGDTKWKNDIPQQYKKCDTVCIHLGALIESEEKEPKNKFYYYKGPECEALINKKGHPYLFGLLRYFKEIQNFKKNNLLLISEFGEELKGGIRLDLIRRLNQLLKNEPNHVCLPVDIGLNVILTRQEKNKNKTSWKTTPYKTWCIGCTKYVDADKIRYKHFGYGKDEALIYFCDVCLKSKPENIIQEKMRLHCESGLPLQKATENDSKN